MPRRRELTGIADAVAGSFASRNNDVNGYWALGLLYQRAKEGGSLQVTVRLLPQDENEVGEPMASVRTGYRAFLRRHLRKRRIPEPWVASASVEIQFESATAMPEFLGTYAGCRPFRCQVLLLDDLNREHMAASTGWCWPHDPARETQSARMVTSNCSLQRTALPPAELRR